MRPIRGRDQAFLYQVYAGTRTEELAPLPWDEAEKAAFLRMQFDAQHKYYGEQFPDARFDVVLDRGRRIGRLYVDRRAEEIRVIDIALLPECRGKGIVLSAPIHTGTADQTIDMGGRLAKILFRVRFPVAISLAKVQCADDGHCMTLFLHAVVASTPTGQHRMSCAFRAIALRVVYFAIGVN